jgi:very-short-patch-repair endonuclease
MGFTDSQIRTMVARGWLLRARRGLFAVGHASDLDEARWAHALGAFGPTSALDGWSAAHAWGVVEHAPTSVQVIAPRARRPALGAKLRVDRRMDETWTTTHRGVRILTPTRTIVRLARTWRPERMVSVMREMAFRGLLDIDALHDVIEFEAGHPGIPDLGQSLCLRATGTAGARSALELRVLDRLARSWTVAPRFNVRIGAGSRTIEVDVAWPDLLICGEIDGPLHDEPDVRRQDLERDAALRADGWRVFRIHWAEFAADPDGALAPLLAAVAAAHCP